MAKWISFLVNIRDWLLRCCKHVVHQFLSSQLPKFILMRLGTSKLHFNLAILVEVWGFYNSDLHTESPSGVWFLFSLYFLHIRALRSEEHEKAQKRPGCGRSMPLLEQGHSESWETPHHKNMWNSFHLWTYLAVQIFRFKCWFHHLLSMLC